MRCDRAMVIRSIIAGGVLVNVDRAVRQEGVGGCVRSMPVLLSELVGADLSALRAGKADMLVTRNAKQSRVARLCGIEVVTPDDVVGGLDLDRGDAR